MVSVWRSSTINEIRDLQAMAVANQEQSLAELRYLKHKIDRLEERTASLTRTGPTLPVSHGLPRFHGRTAPLFREPVTASLVDTLGIPTRFSSLGSSNVSPSQVQSAQQAASPDSTPSMIHSTEQPTGEFGTPVPGNGQSVRLVSSPGSVRHQVERAQREAEEIETSMEERVEEISESTPSMDME
jgi:hypothetical protein